MSALFATVDQWDAHIEHIGKRLKAARYWLAVSEANNDGSALHAQLIAERRRKVERLKDELERSDDATIIELELS